MYALATDGSVYVRLTGECHWTPGRYADLIASTLTATLGDHVTAGHGWCAEG